MQARCRLMHTTQAPPQANRQTDRQMAGRESMDYHHHHNGTDHHPLVSIIVTNHC